MTAAMVGGPIAMIMIIIAGVRARSVLTKGRSPATAHAGPLPARNGFTRYRRPYRGPLLVGALVTITMVLVDLAAPWPLVIVLDNVIGGAALPEFLDGLSRFSPGALAAASATASFALVGIGALLGYLVAYINGASRARIGADVRTAVFADLQYAPLRFHEENRTGDLVSRLDEDVDQIEDFLVAPYETALPELLTVGGILAVLVVVDRWLALVALAAIPLLLLWARLAHPAVRRAERIARDRSGEVANRATEGLRNVRAVQAFSQEERNSARFRSSSDAAAVSEIDALERSARLAPVASLVLAAGSSAVLYVGALRVLDGALSIGVLVVVLAYVSQLYQPIEALTVLVLALAKGAASRDRLLEILRPGSSVVESPDAIDPGGSPRSIGMRDVSFSYDGSRPVLDRVTFQIRNGRRVSIVGATGSGKSTILALLLRLYEPTSGAVMFDGSDVRTLKLERLRKQIALVPQDAWIVDGSISDNISFGAPAATAEDIECAARLALVDEFAAGFPDGYDTVVGEGGAMLSGGQRRRIALARAILRDAPILLLDEPTSGLDAISERYVLDAIDSVGVGRTVIVVTHSLRIARDSDRIMVLHGGRLVESGTHDGLLRRDRRYGAMWSAQNQRPAVEAVEATWPRLVAAQTTGRR